MVRLCGWGLDCVGWFVVLVLGLLVVSECLGVWWKLLNNRYVWSVELRRLERFKIVVFRSGFPRVHVMSSGVAGYRYSTHAIPPIVLAPVVKTSLPRSRKGNNRRGKQIWPNFEMSESDLDPVVLCIYLRRCDGVFRIIFFESRSMFCSKYPYFSSFFFFYFTFFAAVVFLRFLWYCSSIREQKNTYLGEVNLSVVVL